MGKTIAEKIVSHAASTNAVAGDIVNAKLSYLMINDAVGESTIAAFNELESPPWDADRIVVVLDHYVPASTENAARVHKILRDFARNFGTRLYDGVGVCHQLMLEDYVTPGELLIGTDSHTCTYGGLSAFGTGVGSTDGAAAMATGEIWLKVPETIRIELSGSLKPQVHPKDVILEIIGRIGADGATYMALEFGGNGAKHISLDGRCTMCNMAIEAGAKTGIFVADELTIERFPVARERMELLTRDGDANYSKVIEIDLDSVVPHVARPYSVDNTLPAAQITGTRIDQAFLGSCTNGRIEDLRIAADVLRNRKIAESVRMLVSPASQSVYLNAVKEGLVDVFIEAGAIIGNPGCSACFGGQGMLWDGEVCIGTHNRNFRGRMGHRDAEVYLASPETVAKSAIAGCIVEATNTGGGM